MSHGSTSRKYTKLIAKIAEVFSEDFNSYEKPEITVLELGTDTLAVKVVKMYEYVNCSFNNLKKLAVVFDTEDFNMDKWSSGGCETCDYGSRYSMEFTFKPVKEMHD